MNDTQFRCYACGTTLVQGTPKCPGCDAEQTRTALALFRSERQLKATIERWRIITFATGLVCLVAGLGMGMWAMQSKQSTRLSNTTPESFLTNIPEERALNHLNDIFMRSIDEALGLGLMSWVWAEDSTLVLEMRPPTNSQPDVLWQVLSTEERQQVIGFIGVEYTRVRLMSGIPYDLNINGHPPVALRYRNHPNWLALRRRDGSLHVFSTPYDQ